VIKAVSPSDARANIHYLMSESRRLESSDEDFVDEDDDIIDEDDDEEHQSASEEVDEGQFSQASALLQRLFGFVDIDVVQPETHAVQPETQEMRSQLASDLAVSRRHLCFLGNTIEICI
jgi:hypothetical protein